MHIAVTILTYILVFCAGGAIGAIAMVVVIGGTREPEIELYAVEPAYPYPPRPTSEFDPDPIRREERGGVYYGEKHGLY